MRLRRPVVFVLLSLAVSLALVVRCLSGDRETEPGPPIVITSEAPRLRADESERPSPYLELPPEGSTRLDAAPATPAAPLEVPPSDPPTCIVLGRVVDQSDRPLEGVTVRLQAYRAWSEHDVAPQIAGSANARGFEVATRADGTFRFAVPPPTNQTTFVTFVPDAFHDWKQVFFSTSRGGSRPRLIAGEHDVGSIRLVPTGAIRGRVTDSSGKPVRGARLDVGDNRSGTLAENAMSGADGAYAIEHVKAGSVKMHVKCEGFLSRTGPPVEVIVGQFTDAVDLVLEPAPTVSGVVVNEFGAPLEGAWIQGVPTSFGEGVMAKSGANGAFTLSLPQNEPYSLTATLSGFDPYPANKLLEVHAAGATDVRIEMTHATTWALRIVDAKSGAPVELFGVALQRDTSRHGRGNVFAAEVPERMEAHADGRVDVAWRPGLDTLVVVAPSYAKHIVDVDPTTLDSEPIVVALERGAALTGRVLCDRVPESGAEISLEPGYFSPDGVGVDGAPAQQRFHPNTRRAERLFTDVQGRFYFGGLGSGPYRIVVRARGDRIHESEPFELAAHEQKDLGDLELGVIATITGSVLVPPGRSAMGLTIYLNDWNAQTRDVTDGDGMFRFTGLAPGTHRLVLESVSGLIADPPPLEVTVRAGEERKVVYDVRDRGTCAVELTILFASRPAANREVTLVVPGTPDRNARMGRTDEHGRVGGWGRAGTEVLVEIMTDTWTLIRHPTERLELELDGRVEATVNFDFGALVIELPTGVTIPEGGRAVLTVSRTGAETKVVQQLLLPLDGKSELRTDAFLERAARKLHFATVFAGSFDVDLTIDALDASWTGVIDETDIRDGQGRFERTASVVIESGQTTELRLQ